MEVGDKLKELNMTADEIGRLTSAFKDDKFRIMLRDYAEEISDPENRKRYEEEIKILEQERGNTIDFLHPAPFRAIKTSVDGKKKCFINICANEKVGKPAAKCVVEDGHRGQRWSLPHSLHPGRQDKDPKGNKIVIYDVVFHPDTLHIASKNKRFMNMVDDTAIQGIQDAFKVTLDKNNVKELKIKYKGTPHPCVIRKPIPGYEAKKPTEEPDPLAFPYPDEKRSIAKPATTASSEAKPKIFPIQPQQPKEPTKPNYTVKYRSFIDLQDFRCSRDSAQSPRPKEIVVTIDMPLLKSVTDTNLEVTEKSLLLESEKPAYRLELPLAYPVDEDKGKAKFNKQTGQLTVTLPVLPPDLTSDIFNGTAADFWSDGEVQDKEEEDEWEETRAEARVKEERQIEKLDLKQETPVEEKEGKRVQDGGQKQVREGEKCEAEETGAGKGERRQLEGEGQESGTKEKEDSVKEQEEINKTEHGQLLRQDTDDDLNKSMEDKCDATMENGGIQFNTSVQKSDISDEVNSDDIRAVPSPKTETQHSCISTEQSCSIREEVTSKIKPSDIQEETRDAKAGVQGNTQVGTDAASSEDSQASIIRLDKTEECCISKEDVKASTIPSTDDENKRDSDKQFTLCSADVVTMDSAKPEGRTVEDELTTKRNPEHKKKKKAPPAILREIDKDGNETVISDHSTSAGFIFQNKLMYELD
ncbi:protein kintoun [Mugil cephalus]|uniref:protein kintoun n=1 Tax=Mugil cephalus TaxID=48193 RepID=UPI001FB59089|nr:protein kintoun [Mugil cephalus]